ncbi:MAG: tetratricopeptide repeat protein [Luteibaculaceae bacterium]
MKKSYLIFIGVFVLVTLVIGLMPKAPKSVTSNLVISQVDIEINKAIEMVQTGAPMEGIMRLRSLLDEHQDNARIHFELGQFSITSGQNQKAIQRFEKVIELDNENFPEAYFFLGRLQVEEGLKTQGIENLRTYQTFATDSVIVNGIENMINEIINQ